MATELVSCPACGIKNPSDRTTCLSCGAGFSISEEVSDEPKTELSPHHTQGLKLGEVILLWAGGLWTVLVIIVAFFAWAVSSDGKPSHYLFGTFAFSLPIWIICGLIWATIHGRARKNPQFTSVKTNEQPTIIREIFGTPRRIRRAFGEITENIFDDIVVALISGIALALPVAVVIWLVDLAHRPVGEWLILPTLEDAFPSFRQLFDGGWKIAGWTIYEKMVGFFLLFFLCSLFLLWSYKFYEWVNWVVLQRHMCSNCYQWRKDEEAAHECCRSLPPTRAWIKRHNLVIKRDLWKWGAFLLPFPPLFALFLASLGAVFNFASFSWHYWLNTTLALYALAALWFYLEVYRPYKNQEPCSGCGVRADNYTSRTSLPLCSRCYAKER